MILYIVWSFAFPWFSLVNVAKLCNRLTLVWSGLHTYNLWSNWTKVITPQWNIASSLFIFLYWLPYWYAVALDGHWSVRLAILLFTHCQGYSLSMGTCACVKCRDMRVELTHACILIVVACVWQRIKSEHNRTGLSILYLSADAPCVALG